MKRFLFIRIAVVLVFVVYGCGENYNGGDVGGNIITPDGDAIEQEPAPVRPHRPLRVIDSIAARFNEFHAIISNRDHLAEMVFIESAGRTFTRGDSSLTDISRFEHQVSFSYNFYMDIEEVTIMEYYVITGNPQSPFPNFDIAEWRDLELPVGGLTFSDAILFLNKRSKFYGLDTVYIYDGIVNGVLQGLRADNTRNGFALPTQAEWEYVARMYAYDHARVRDQRYVFAGSSANAPRRASEMQAIGGFKNFFGNMREYCWSKMDDYLRLPPLIRDPDIHGLRFSAGDQVVRMGGSFTASINQIQPSFRSSQNFDETVMAVVRHNGIRAVIRQGVTEPGVTEPEVTEPGVTEPGVTEPGVTEPGVTEPDTTIQQ